MRYLVHNRMRGPVDGAVAALFPAEQARAAELFAQGTLEEVYVAADYAQAWLIVRGETVEEARAAVASLPLAPFVASAFTPLAEV